MRLLAFLLAFWTLPAQALSPAAMYAALGGGRATAWNPVDFSTGISLSNDNLTATSDTGGSQSVRVTSSRQTGRWCAGILASTISTNFNVGLVDSAYVLNVGGGLGVDAHGIGFDPNTAANQGIFFNNAILSSSVSAISTNGDNLMICMDLDAKTFWATSAAMQTANGIGAWNSSSSCNPTVPSCGLSFSAMNCPCFLAYNNATAAGVAVLETLRSQFPYALPAGFNAWDSVGGL